MLPSTADKRNEADVADTNIAVYADGQKENLFNRIFIHVGITSILLLCPRTKEQKTEQ